MTVDPLNSVLISELSNPSLVWARHSQNTYSIFAGSFTCFFNATVRFSLYIKRCTYQVLLNISRNEMSVQSMSIAHAIQLHAMWKSGLHNSDILVYFCLVPIGASLRFHHRLSPESMRNRKKFLLFSSYLQCCRQRIVRYF